MRYAYAITAALLLGGTALAVSQSQPLGAQNAASREAAQNEGIRALAPAGAPVSLADMVEKLQPAVVNISTRQRVVTQPNPLNDLFGSFFGAPRSSDGPQIQEGTSLGTGFFVSSDGYIVTNNHVVAAGTRNATVESITVTLSDHTEYAAELVGRDETADLAVLKIKPRGKTPFVRFGTTKNARVGDWVIVIGQPLGLEGTVTTGIISNIARTTGSGSPYDRFIQTDASINQGNSGGPMFDLQGNVLGINTWIASPNGGNVGLGFAVPGEIAKPIVDKLIRGEKVERGYLGVGYAQINDKLALALGVEKNHGVFVNAVPGDGPAAKAGIQPRDVLLSVGGQSINLDNPLSVIIANLPIGKSLPVELIRDGKRRTVNVVLTNRPSERELAGGFAPDDGDDDGSPLPQPGQGQGASTPAGGDIGLALLDLNPAIRRQLGLDDKAEAVVVNGVNAQSDAAIVGIQPGDLIFEVDGRKIRSTADVKAATGAAKKAGKSAVLLLLARPGSRFRGYVPVELSRN